MYNVTHEFELSWWHQRFAEMPIDYVTYSDLSSDEEEEIDSQDFSIVQDIREITNTEIKFELLREKERQTHMTKGIRNYLNSVYGVNGFSIPNNIFSIRKVKLNLKDVTKPKDKDPKKQLLQDIPNNALEFYNQMHAVLKLKKMVQYSLPRYFIH